MKLTKFIMPVMMLAVMLISSQAFSQQSKFTPEDMAKRMTDMLTKNLDLTTDQQGQVHDIVLDYATTHDRSNFDRAELSGKIETVLTDDQKVKYAELREKMKKDKQQK